MMSSGLKLAAGNKLRSILERATANRFVAVTVGILVTLLVQSSSATDMMVISFVNSGLMTLSQAIGVVMGANIGTTVTAQITAFNLGAYAPLILFTGAVIQLFVKNSTVKHIGTVILGFGMLFFGISVIKSAIVPLSKSASFISFLSTLENPAVAVLFGVLFTALMLILITVFPAFLDMIQSLTPGDIGHQVANTHTIFAILAVILEFPFANAIVALSQKVIPVLPEENRAVEDRKLRYLVQTGDLPSSVAIQQARLELIRMGKIARDSLADAVRCFFELDDHLAEEVLEREDTVDILTEKIQDRLISLRSKDYAPSEVNRLSQLMLVSSDMERISDYAENIAEYEAAYKERKASMSEAAREELKTLAEASLRSIDFALRIFADENYQDLPEADRLEQAVDDLQTSCENAHIERLMEERCDPVAGVLFTDMINDLERCSDHAINIAYALSGQTEPD